MQMRVRVDNTKGWIQDFRLGNRKKNKKWSEAKPDKFLGVEFVKNQALIMFFILFQGVYAGSVPKNPRQSKLYLLKNFWCFFKASCQCCTNNFAIVLEYHSLFYATRECLKFRYLLRTPDVHLPVNNKLHLSSRTQLYTFIKNNSWKYFSIFLFNLAIRKM